MNKRTSKTEEAVMIESLMTTAERVELSRVVRLRTKVRRADIDEFAARQKAEVETQLAKIYRKDDPRWAKITAKMEIVLAQGAEELAEVLQQEGIPAEFGPTMGGLGWAGRGENAFAARRAELRKMAYKKIEANAVRAEAQLLRTEVSLLEQIAARGLRTTDAKQFLESIPKIEEMMPSLETEVVEMDKKLPKPKDGYEYRYLRDRGLDTDYSE
jgi:hypothetical protein